MVWPSMSPDLSPIEHQRGILKWKVEDSKVSNIRHLRVVIMEGRKRIPVATCEALVNSIANTNNIRYFTELFGTPCSVQYTIANNVLSVRFNQSQYFTKAWRSSACCASRSTQEMSLVVRGSGFLTTRWSRSYQ